MREFIINGVEIGIVNDVYKNDVDGRLINVINFVKDCIGVEVSLDI